MQTAEALAHIQNEEGQVHGKNCRFFFDRTPTQMFDDHNAVLRAFTILDGEVKFNSWCINRRGDNESRDLTDIE